MANFVDFVYWLERVGVADVLLPFLLIFVIIFAILQKTGILGDSAKRYNVIVAIVLGAAAVFPHILGRGPDVVEVINKALPNVSIVIVAIIMFLILLGAFGVQYNIVGKKIGGLISLIAIGLIIYIFGAAAGWGWKIPNWLWFLNDPETVTFLIIIIVFGLIIMYITKEEETGGGEGRSEWFKEWFIKPTGGGGNTGGGGKKD